MSYFDYTSIRDYDQTIGLHPFMEACDGSIVYRLLLHFGTPCHGKVVLDFGAGTGQVTRMLQGIPGLVVEALDIDPLAKTYFAEHPELRDVTFLTADILQSPLPRSYDAVVARGVYHHLPKSRRPEFLKLLTVMAPVVIIADEGILEYADESERVANCEVWYSFIINEAKRRGITKLAEEEAQFLEHERLHSADDGGDFKESPSHLIQDAKAVGLHAPTIDRLGPWQSNKGGFFTATFTV